MRLLGKSAVHGSLDEQGTVAVSGNQCQHQPYVLQAHGDIIHVGWIHGIVVDKKQSGNIPSR